MRRVLRFLPLTLLLAFAGCYLILCSRAPCVDDGNCPGGADKCIGGLCYAPGVDEECDVDDDCEYRAGGYICTQGFCIYDSAAVIEDAGATGL